MSVPVRFTCASAPDESKGGRRDEMDEEEGKRRRRRKNQKRATFWQGVPSTLSLSLSLSLTGYHRTSSGVQHQIAGYDVTSRKTGSASIASTECCTCRERGHTLWQEHCVKAGRKLFTSAQSVQHYVDPPPIHTLTPINGIVCYVSDGVKRNSMN